MEDIEKQIDILAGAVYKQMEELKSIREVLSQLVERGGTYEVKDRKEEDLFDDSKYEEERDNNL